MKRKILNYIFILCLITLIIAHVHMLFWLSIPIRDNAISMGKDYSLLFYLKYTSTYIIFLLFALIGCVLLVLRDKRGLFFSVLFVIYNLITNLFVVKFNWIYFTQWGIFILFFVFLFYFEIYKDYKLNKNQFINYMLIITIIIFIEFIPLLLNSFL
jgi:hypothetical protein